MTECGYRWPLLEPNEEDRRNGTTHLCRHPIDHDDEHRCTCGARPADQ